MWIGRKIFGRLNLFEIEADVLTDYFSGDWEDAHHVCSYKGQGEWTILVSRLPGPAQGEVDDQPNDMLKGLDTGGQRWTWGVNGRGTNLVNYCIYLVEKDTCELTMGATLFTKLNILFVLNCVSPKRSKPTMCVMWLSPEPRGAASSIEVLSFNSFPSIPPQGFPCLSSAE